MKPSQPPNQTLSLAALLRFLTFPHALQRFRSSDCAKSSLRSCWHRVRIMDEQVGLEDTVADMNTLKNYFRLNKRELLERAQNGEAEALFELGYRLRQGVGFSCDEERSLELTVRAALLGHPVALGFCFYNAIRVTRDEQRALELYLQASQHNSVAGKLSAAQERQHSHFFQAITSVAFCYDSGSGTHRDRTESLRLCRMAAEMGYVRAQYNYAQKLHRLQAAEHMLWLRKAAQQEHPMAMNKLATHYQMQGNIPLAAYYYRLVQSVAVDLPMFAFAVRVEMQPKLSFPSK
jgi:TPR repeat protein